MNIQRPQGSTGLFGAGTAKARGQRENSGNDKIKMLQDQKELVQKRIARIREQIADKEVSSEMIEPLKAEITSLDAQITQERIAQAEKKTEQAGQKDGANKKDKAPMQAGTQPDKVPGFEKTDERLLQAFRQYAVYNKAGTLIRFGTKSTAQAQAMRSDAQTLLSHGGKKTAADLLSDADSLSAKADGAVQAAIRQTAGLMKKPGKVKTSRKGFDVPSDDGGSKDEA